MWPMRDRINRGVRTSGSYAHIGDAFLAAGMLDSARLAFEQALAAQKITLQKLRDETRAELAVEKYIEAKVGAKAAVTDAQINDFYKNNQDKFKQGPQIRASHILITVPANADAAAKAAAKAKADEHQASGIPVSHAR